MTLGDRQMDTHMALEPVPRPQQYQEERAGGKTWTRPHMASTNRQEVRGSGKAIEPERERAPRRSHQLEP